MTSEAFAVDLAKTGLLRPGDKLALRVSQPLRVTNGGFGLTVPVTYDYATGHAGLEQRFFDLSPRGREVDYEVAYGLGLWGGELDVNAFVRSDPGHVEAMRRDIGAALRFTVRK